MMPLKWLIMMYAHKLIKKNKMKKILFNAQVVSDFLLLLISVFTACSDSDNASHDENGGTSPNSYWTLKIGNQWILLNPENNTDKMDYLEESTL